MWRINRCRPEYNITRWESNIQWTLRSRILTNSPCWPRKWQNRCGVLYNCDSIRSAQSIQRGFTEGIAFSNIMLSRSQYMELEAASIMHWEQEQVDCLSHGTLEGTDVFEKSSDEIAYIGHCGASSLLKAVDKKSLPSIYTRRGRHTYRATFQACCRSHPIANLHHWGQRTRHMSASFASTEFASDYQDVNSNIFIRRGSKPSVWLVYIYQ